MSFKFKDNNGTYTAATEGAEDKYIVTNEIENTFRAGNARLSECAEKIKIENNILSIKKNGAWKDIRVIPPIKYLINSKNSSEGNIFYIPDMFSYYNFNHVILYRFPKKAEDDTYENKYVVFFGCAYLKNIVLSPGLYDIGTVTISLDIIWNAFKNYFLGFEGYKCRMIYNDELSEINGWYNKIEGWVNVNNLAQTTNNGLRELTGTVDSGNDSDTYPLVVGRIKKTEQGNNAFVGYDQYNRMELITSTDCNALLFGVLYQ